MTLNESINSQYNSQAVRDYLATSTIICSNSNPFQCCWKGCVAFYINFMSKTENATSVNMNYAFYDVKYFVQMFQHNL